MAAMASGPYLPVESEQITITSPVETKSEGKKKDPLFEAMFGAQTGTSKGPASPPSKSQQFGSIGIDTLDEPVIETLKRDLNNIADKLKAVLMMRSPPTETLTDWELWGPLIMCLSLAVSLGISSSQSVFVFTLVFTLVWIGSIAVIANARLLGYKISFFQNVCLLGYGLFPLVAASTLNMVFPLLWILKVALSGIACGWSTAAATRTLNDESLADRKLLASFPIGLFYFVFAWLIIIV